MTHHMTNERLAELREAAAEDRLRPCGQPLYEFRDVIVSDDDVRGLLAMLDQERAKAIKECQQLAWDMSRAAAATAHGPAEFVRDRTMMSDSYRDVAEQIREKVKP